MPVFSIAASKVSLGFSSSLVVIRGAVSIGDRGGVANFSSLSKGDSLSLIFNLYKLISGTSNDLTSSSDYSCC